MAPQIVDLVLEGGGVRGIALAGAIEVLEEHGLKPNRVAGASAGAIVGALVAAGMPAKRLHETMMTLDYTRFLDESDVGRIPVIGHGLALLGRLAGAALAAAVGLPPVPRARS